MHTVVAGIIRPPSLNRIIGVRLVWCGDPDAPMPAALAAAGLPLRHLGLYAYRMSFLRDYPDLPRCPLESLESLEQLRALWHGHAIVVTIAASMPAPGVDTPADLDRVRRIFSQRS